MAVVDCFQVCSCSSSSKALGEYQGARDGVAVGRSRLKSNQLECHVRIRSSSGGFRAGINSFERYGSYGSNGWSRTSSSATRRGKVESFTAKSMFGNGGNGGDGNQSGVGRVVFNIALTAALAYLTVTGRLGWVFDAIFSLWLLFLLAPLVAIVAYLWFVERKIITGNCPNCGNEFQVFEFAVKDQLQLCPYCTQPFKVENKIFVRDGPRYATTQTGPSRNTSFSDRESDSGGPIVDVEAEVLDD